jgi:signal transduction histidine kinase
VLPLWAFLAGHSYLLLRLAGKVTAFAAVARELLPLLVAACLLAPLMLRAARSFPLGEGRRYSSLAAHAGALLLLAALDHLLERGLYLLLDPGFGRLPTGHFRPAFASDGWDGLLGSLCGIGPFYLLVVTAYHALSFRAAHQERALKAALLEAEHSQSRLQVLKSQLHPHFLFNALNALYGHIPVEAETAQRMVVLLSDFLRRSLQELGEQRTTLGRDLEFARLYLDIQGLRFPGLLQVAWEVEAGLDGMETPHLLLQPLVENAVKHGFAERTEPGRLLVRARRALGCLELEVLDDGPGAGAAPQPGAGTGLANIRKRLNHLYGDLAALECGPRPEGGFRVRVSLPLKEVKP